MDWLDSVRRDAACLRSAGGDSGYRQWANYSRRLQVFDQHGMGSALADGPHLSRAGVGKKVRARGYAGAADGCVVVRPVLRRQVCICGRSRRECVGAGEAGGGNSARLGWADVGGFRGANDRNRGASGTGAVVAGAEAGRGGGYARVGRGFGRAQLEELSVDDVAGLAGKCAYQTTGAVAAAGVLRLREPADGGD